MFQSTRPYGARRRVQNVFQGHLCFNPRARMGRDETDSGSSKQPEVSIHAPVWGATIFVGIDFMSEHVSIHAPVWGATSRVRS